MPFFLDSGGHTQRDLELFVSGNNHDGNAPTRSTRALRASRMPRAMVDLPDDPSADVM